jgi:hypothetical protein
MRKSAQIALLLAGAGAALTSAGFAAAADGGSRAVPQFAFMNGGWQAMGADFLQPASGPGPVQDEPGRRHVGNNVGGQPSFRMADLSNPILQPWTRAALKQVNDKIATGGGGFSPQVSCILMGVPAYLLHPAQPLYFTQTDKEVIMVWPPNHEVRHIYLTDKHSANVKPTWSGESIGHYENGDTLVVDTIGLNTKTYVDNFRTPHTDKLHVIERFRINPDAKGLTVEVTVDDPGAFTMPWHAIQRYRRVEQGPMPEESCAENPTNFLSYDMDPIPQASKADF